MVMLWEKVLSTKKLDESPDAGAIKGILAAALNAADPADAVRRRLARGLNLLQINGQEYPLNNIAALYLVSVGKAAIPMAEAAAEILGDVLQEGIVVTKKDPKNNQKPFESFPQLVFSEASHPVPDERSLAAGERVLQLLEKSAEKDLVIFLISGGGSALITAPVNGVSLEDMSALTSLLLGCGAPIDETNTLRRALDRVKGGGLAEAAAPARIVSLLLSDVINSPLEAIASGPTVPNPTSNADALALLKKYNLLEQVPKSILVFLEKDVQPPRFSFKRAGEGSRVSVIGSNLISAQAAKIQAEKEGFFAEVLTTSLEGEAAEVGRELGLSLCSGDFSRYARTKVLTTRFSRPFCLILGGETTVTLGDAAGFGGRNQEVALAAVKELAGAEKVMLITLATDGDDGPTDAAGAVVTGETLARAQALRLDVEEHLCNHDAYPFFAALGDLLKPGMTGTNVNDLIFLFAF